VKVVVILQLISLTHSLTPRKEFKKWVVYQHWGLLDTGVLQRGVFGGIRGHAKSGTCGQMGMYRFRRNDGTFWS